jgi:DNA-binding NarL/FixJ family response regulator
MLGALNLVLAGGTYIPPDVLDRQGATAADRAPAAAPPAAVAPSGLALTRRQAEVLAHMMQGLSNKAICRKLDLAERTVKNSVTAIFKALQVSNRTAAVIKAGKLGWEPLKPE